MFFLALRLTHSSQVMKLQCMTKAMPAPAMTTTTTTVIRAAATITLQVWVLDLPCDHATCTPVLGQGYVLCYLSPFAHLPSAQIKARHQLTTLEASV